jgi:hypothetical protein
MLKVGLGEEEPFVQWTKEVRRTTGMDAGLEGCDRDASQHRANAGKNLIQFKVGMQT